MVNCLSLGSLLFLCLFECVSAVFCLFLSVCLSVTVCVCVYMCVSLCDVRLFVIPGARSPYPPSPSLSKLCSLTRYLYLFIFLYSVLWLVTCIYTFFCTVDSAEGLKIVHLNIRSLASKTDSLRAWLTLHNPISLPYRKHGYIVISPMMK